MGTGPKPGWPKFYGVMESLRIQPPGKAQLTYRKQETLNDYSLWELDEVWKKAFCPAMDADSIMRASDAALATLDAWAIQAKPAQHRAAVGYQWNVTLRAAGANTEYFPSGRWPTAVWRPNVDWGTWDNTYWIDFELNIAGASGTHVCQAIHPDEIEQPASVAEAWDGWDLDSLPGINWFDPQYQGQWSWENMVPGWHVGPQTEHCGGWALLNGARHPTSPNVLYADGHVNCDAVRDVPTNQLGALPGGGSWQDAKVKSWEDFDQTFGTMVHIVPQRSFTVDGR